MAALRESTSPSSTHTPAMTLRTAGAWVPSGWLPDAVAAVSRVTPGYWAVRAISGAARRRVGRPGLRSRSGEAGVEEPGEPVPRDGVLAAAVYRSVWTAPGMVTNSLLSPVSRAKASLPM